MWPYCTVLHSLTYIGGGDMENVDVEGVFECKNLIDFSKALAGLGFSVDFRVENGKVFIHAEHPAANYEYLRITGVFKPDNAETRKAEVDAVIKGRL